MKKGILLLLGLMTATVMNADIKKSTNEIGVNYRYNDAITFVERGIKFHIFLNGDFDFNTHARSNRYYDYNGIRTHRGVRIKRDYRGRIRSVGNVFINYDSRGNVKRIGNVFMRYKYGQLSRVGNLKIKYNRWGEPRFKGRVKGRNYHNQYYDEYEYEYDRNYDNDFGLEIDIDIFDYDDAYFFKRDFKDNYRKFREDDKYFYYRANPNAKIGKRSNIIKRKRRVEDSFSKPEQHGRSKRNR